MTYYGVLAGDDLINAFARSGFKYRLKLAAFGSVPANTGMLRLPITLDDAKKMTSSELTEAINRCWDEIEKKFDPKRAHAKAFGEYVRAREEIRARSLKSKIEDRSDDKR